MLRRALDPPSRSDNALQHLPAGLKLFLALALVISVVLTPPSMPWILAGIAGLLGITVLVGRISCWLLLRRLLLLEPLALGVASLTLLQPQGWQVFLWLSARSTLCLLALVLLSSTTPVGELLAVLRRLHLPTLLVTTMALMYRYLSVLLEESTRMRRARAARTFVTGRRRTWRTLATVVGALFLRSVDRSERIYAAMCARGWR